MRFALPLLLAAAVLPVCAQPEGTGILAGVVVMRSTNEPVRKVVLRLEWLGKPASVAQERTDATGTFAFRNLPPGRYRLTAEKRGTGAGAYGVTRPGQAGRILTLAAGEARTDLMVTLTAYGRISGTVVLDGDTAPEYSRLELLRRSYTEQGPRLVHELYVQADDHGQFRFNNVQPGRYYLAYGGQSGLGNESFPKQFYGGTDDWQSAQPIDVKPGQAVEDVEIRARAVRLVAVSGTVSGLAPLPPTRDEDSRSACLARLDEESGCNYRGTITREGRYRIDNVVPGRYTLRAMVNEKEQHYYGAREVSVTGNVEGLDIAVRTVLPLKGRVRVDGPGAPALGELTVELQPSPSWRLSWRAEVNPDGAFFFPQVEPESWRIQLKNLPEGVYRKAILLGKEDFLARPLTIPPDNTEPLTIVLDTRAARLDGRIALRDAEPKSFQVVLVPEPRYRHLYSFYSQTEPDAAGRFTLTGLRPGHYHLFAVERLPEGSQWDPAFWAAIERYGKEVNVEPGAKLEIDPDPVPEEALP